MKTSAGILPYRLKKIDELEIMLVHPGGPFWKNKDLKSWSIAKGIVNENEEHLDAAKREFKEETNFELNKNNKFIFLMSNKLSNKIIKIWAIEDNFDVSKLKSNTFELEYPKGSKIKTYPEVDRAEWFSIPIAREKIHKNQIVFITRLIIQLEKIKEKKIEKRKIYSY